MYEQFGNGQDKKLKIWQKNYYAKKDFVQNVFSKVACKYDLMNDLMSLFIHRLWKKNFVKNMVCGKSAKVLDLAGGTGDIAYAFYQKNKGLEPNIVICDINQNMLDAGIKKLSKDSELFSWVCGAAESLPFADSEFDICTASFGVRNFSDLRMAFTEIRRVLKPDGKFYCLEFSKVDNKIIALLYRLYSWFIIPTLGWLIAGNREAYKYLVESIEAFYTPDELAEIIKSAGFTKVSFLKMTFGIVAIHQAE